MHENRRLIEGRISRELAERLPELIHREQRPMSVSAGPTRSEQRPFEIGTAWGSPWSTTWFTVRGEIPAEWADRRIEAIIDLGFHGDAAGFQCEGLLVDGDGVARRGVHPRRMAVPVDGAPGPVELTIEAAANPSFVQFRPPTLGGREAAGLERPLLYRFRRAELVLVDSEAEALAYDLEVLDGVMRTLGGDDPRRRRLSQQIAAALDLLPDIAAARRLLTDAYREPARTTSHRIVATGHAHIDTAWLWPLRETVRKCTRTFASTVDLLDRSADHRFSCSQAQHYAWIESAQPALFERIRQHVDAGRWIPVGGMWVESDMNLPAGESIVRQILYGQRYFIEKFGLRCDVMWIPDVFGYPAGLPQVFAAGGMRRFVTQKLSWNKQNRFPHHTFYWEGLDGTRILTHFPPVDTYNAEITPAEVADAAANFRDQAWSDWSLMPFGHGDGGGGPTREMIERARRLADLDGAPRVEIGTPGEFFDHVDAEIHAGAPIAVWRGELYFETHRGTLTSQRRTKAANQRCERLFREVELWAATLGRPADVDEIWTEVLTQQFHDILPGSSIAWVHADAEEILAAAAQRLDRRRRELLAELVAPGDGEVLTNTTSAARREVVLIDGTAEGDGPTQRIIGDDGAERTALYTTVPALGMARPVATAIDDRVVVTDRSFMNGSLAVRWDHTGHLISIIDLVRRRELVPTDRRVGELTLAVDQPVEYDAWDLEPWTAGRDRSIDACESVEVLDAGPLVGRVRVRRRFGESSAELTYTLRAGSPRLDIDIDIDWQHREHLLSMRFPLAVHADTAACDVQFGVVRRPTHASTPWDAAKYEVCAHRFVDVSEPSFGVAILNDGPYGHGLFDDRSPVGEIAQRTHTEVRVSLLRAARYPDPDADRGRHRMRLAVFAHGGDLGAVVHEAECFDLPVGRFVGTVETPSRTADDRQTIQRPLIGVTVDGAVDGGTAGVLIDAVKNAEPRIAGLATAVDGHRDDDLIVRLHEHLGDRRRITVDATTAIVCASYCNLLEEPLRALEVADGIVTLTLAPFEIVTLRLTLATSR